LLRITPPRVTGSSFSLIDHVGHSGRVEKSIGTEEVSAVDGSPPEQICHRFLVANYITFHCDMKDHETIIHSLLWECTESSSLVIWDSGKEML